MTERETPHNRTTDTIRHGARAVCIGSEAFYRYGERKDADALVRQFHYSRRVPSNVQLCCTIHESGGLYGDAGRAIAAVYFSIPPTRWSEDVWELSRLVRREDQRISLTPLIGHACAECRRRGCHLVVSFADRTHGHHGGIYQAASWNYAGMRNRCIDGVIINGRFVPGRTCNSLYGTRSVDLLRARVVGADIQPHYDEGKHLYWKGLTKEGAKRAARIGLECLPYPKPSLTESGKATP